MPDLGDASWDSHSTIHTRTRSGSSQNAKPDRATVTVSAGVEKGSGQTPIPLTRKDVVKPPSSLIIRLPRYVFENNLRSLLDILALGDDAERIDLDFQAVRYYVPGGIVAVVAKIKKWQRSGKVWRFTNYEENENFGYFQRMDVCNILGLDLPENFSRHSGSEDFVPVMRVPPSDQDVGPIASKLSACVDPNRGETFPLLQFVTSEAVLNARQHSGGEGFVSAQYAKSKETARIGVADCGIGILESFDQMHRPSTGKA
ncbi:MAG TPA: ATP-binding protein [Terrimicrobiaceae bacterium]